MVGSRIATVRRFLPVGVLLGLILAVSLATRVALWAHPGTDVPIDAAHLLQVFAIGLGFDLAAAAYFLAPLVLYLALLPDWLARWRPHRWLFNLMFAAAAYVVVLVALSEWVFWDEFGTRFNFIAVDYLVYTHEVLGNIWESYPVGKLLALICLPVALATYLLRHALAAGLVGPTRLPLRWGIAAVLLSMPAAVFVFVSSDLKDRSSNTQANELAGNGIYQFFAANWNNDLDFERFYATLPRDEAFAQVREMVGGAGGPAASTYRLAHHVHDTSGARRLNVVLISVESLGSEFIGALGNTEGITPELDRLTRDSLFFTQVYATGNRTVRGLEALSLSIPPTPGQSIVKRPRNEDLFTIGALLDDSGYAPKFVYGGYSYFDNMGYFFSHNEYEVVDRSALARGEIHHENIWGVADEDLYTLALREADRSAGDGDPFFLHVMTTSNHRPYTYPDGRIDIPSGSGRNGAVKYTDYAIGKFMREARARPWFDDTIFVITADHGASARGTTDIPLDRYRIPLWIHSPRHVAPGRVDTLASQIDIAPTVLGLLGLDCETKFFGRDLLDPDAGPARAFVATYQTLGYLRDGWLVTLSPRREVRMRRVDAHAPDLDAARQESMRREAISFYQVASQVFREGLYRDDDQPRLHHAIRSRPASHG